MTQASSLVPLHSMAPRLGGWPSSGSSAAFLELVRREQAAVGHAGALVLQVDDAADARLERLADGVEQVRQRRVVRRFLDGRAGGADVAQVAEVGFQRVHQGEAPGCQNDGAALEYKRRSRAGQRLHRKPLRTS